jgi:hypothetical protein
MFIIVLECLEFTHAGRKRKYLDKLGEHFMVKSRKLLLLVIPRSPFAPSASAQKPRNWRANVFGVISGARVINHLPIAPSHRSVMYHRLQSRAANLINSSASSGYFRFHPQRHASPSDLIAFCSDPLADVEQIVVPR